MRQCTSSNKKALEGQGATDHALGSHHSQLNSRIDFYLNNSVLLSKALSCDRLAEEI